MSIAQSITQAWRKGGILPRLIMANAAVWVAVSLAGLICAMAGGSHEWLVDWLALPSAPMTLLLRPWTLLTHMVTHHGVLHLLTNLLWLYWMGQLFLDYFSPRQLGSVYLLGGLGGALLYLLGCNLLPPLTGTPHVLLGASAAVLAVVTAVAAYAPQRRISLLFVGEVQLKWLVTISVVLIVLGGWETNLGGQLAHAGGAITGLLFGALIKQGRDITRPVTAMLDAVATRLHGRTRRRMRGTAAGAPTEEEVDAILAKLKRSGYGSLSRREKQMLFAASSRARNKQQ